MSVRKPKWRNGRRAGLKIRSPQGGVGSSPTFGTDDSRRLRRRPVPPKRVGDHDDPPRTPAGRWSFLLAKVEAVRRETLVIAARVLPAIPIRAIVPEAERRFGEGSHS